MLNLLYEKIFNDLFNKSISDKSINIEKEELWAQILIPSKISLHVLSRNIVSDISTNISIAKNSLYRNVIGFRFDNDIQTSGLKIPTYFLVDYKSNNGFTNEVIDSNQSAVWLEALNRIHAQKSIIEWCLK